MASQSPQRSRKPAAQGTMPVGHQPRDASPSPPLARDRPRNSKTSSMPLVPSATSFAAQQASQNQPNPSPTLPGARRSPPPGAVSRLLPTPPYPSLPNPNIDDRRNSPPPGPQHTHSQPVVSTANYGRGGHRAPIPQYQSPHVEEKWHQMNFGMTPELLADIERAADQQASVSQHSMPYPANGTSSPAKDLNVERVRGTSDRSSPTHAARREREQAQLARESPQARDRPAPSPNMSFSAGPGAAQPQGGHSPEQQHPLPQQQQQRMSPGQNVPISLPSLNEPHPSSYMALYNSREAPATIRRQTVGTASELRANPSMASQTPPLQTIHNNRAPGRSLPVQEEDEVLGKNGVSHSSWQMNEQNPEKSSSPTPSSDLNPEGQRDQSSISSNDNGKQRADHQDSSTPGLSDDDSLRSYVDRDATSDEAAFTPKSPIVGLPLEEPEAGYQNGVHNPVPQTAVPRSRGRNGSGDYVMRGMDNVVMSGHGAEASQNRPSQAAEASRYPQDSGSRDIRGMDNAVMNGQSAEASHNRHLQAEAPRYAQDSGSRRQPYANTSQYRDYPPDAYGHVQQQQHTGYPGGGYPSLQEYYQDDQYDDAYYTTQYLRSPRPSAPIPPTPHSQTAAPSPSPNLARGNPYEYEQAYSPNPSRNNGSPFPYPYSHMRRNPNPNSLGPAPNPHLLRENMARQYQKYALNNHGYVTDSTLSPSATPFRPDMMYQAWALNHAKRASAKAAALDAASMTSSPSHKPVELSYNGFPGGRKERLPASRRQQSHPRQPPPRVESTQPRETSPELSSGDETDRPNTAMESHIDETPVVDADAVIPIEMDDESGEWVDEDEEDDYEDLIDLEYHPSFVKNISKRRRKWEVGWENLIHAFQAVDRQTDATMVLLASPSHSTKLHMIRSRSIRRQPILATSVNMNQIRSGFSHMATQRRATRPDKSSLVERFIAASSSSGDGSDGSSSSVPENLRRVLDAALGSLGTLGEVYEQREARVLEELQRSREDRERVELLLRQVLGDRSPLNRLPPDY